MGATNEIDLNLVAVFTRVVEEGSFTAAAAALRLPKSSVSLLSGDTARKKILRIDGDPEDLSNKLEALLKA